MNVRNLHTLGWVLILTFAMLASCMATSGETTMNSGFDPTNLSSSDNDLRWKTASAIRSAYAHASKQAIDVLEKERVDMDRRQPSIKVIGYLRDPAAVPILCREIELRTSVEILIGELRNVTIGDWYPAAGALAKIGKPAIRQCLWELTKENSDQRRECFCWVVGAVEGPEVGRFVLMLAIAKETDAERKARLQEAVPVFEELFPLKQPDQRNYRPRDQRD